MRPSANASSDYHMETPLICHLNPALGETVRVISDLHLGHERCEVPSIPELAPLLSGIQYLVVAGDLAETRVCDWREKGLKLREEFRQLCRQHKVKLIELSGNHDPDIRFMIASLWEGNTVIMHGHAIYKEVAPWSWEYLRNKPACHALIKQYPDADSDLAQRMELARAMCQLTVPIMRREGIRNPLIRGFMHCFWPPQRPLGIIRGWLTSGRKANQFAEQYFPQAENIILGHFHRSGTWHFGKRTIANTGAWFRHATPYFADLTDGKLVRYAKAAAILNHASPSNSSLLN